jgi:hypothetical protein
MTDITPDHITWEEFEEQFPYGAVVLKDLHIVHVVGYTRPVTEQDCMLLAQELKTDPEFELTDLHNFTPYDLKFEVFNEAPYFLEPLQDQMVFIGT